MTTTMTDAEARAALQLASDLYIQVRALQAQIAALEAETSGLRAQLAAATQETTTDNADHGRG